MKILISACLLGTPCRYDGRSISADSSLLERLTPFLKNGTLVPICPECEGGLSVPRSPAEIEAKKTALDVLGGTAQVLSLQGKNVTAEYLKGAQITLKRCQSMNIFRAVLKEKSPSCGAYSVYDGTFSGTLKSGRGVTAELLCLNGISVSDESVLSDLCSQLEQIA